MKSTDVFVPEATVISAVSLTKLPTVKSVSVSVLSPIFSINALSTDDLAISANLRIFGVPSVFLIGPGIIVNCELPTTSFEPRRIFGSAGVV